jgi:hypothetical protein
LDIFISVCHHNTQSSQTFKTSQIYKIETRNNTMEFRIKTQHNSVSSSAVGRPGDKRSFLDAVKRHHLSKRLGENGCPEYTNEGLGSALLDLNQMVRGGDPTSIVRGILKDGSPLDVAYLMILVFSTRNTRGGKGEKKLAYDMMLEVLREMPETGLKLVKLFPHYGYWKDLFLLMELVKKEPSLHSTTKKNFKATCTELFTAQLRSDMQVMQTYEDKMKAGKSDPLPPKISLLAKWLPRENSSLDKKIGFVSEFANQFFATEQKGPEGSWESAPNARYRRAVVKLTETLKLPEVLLASHREDEIAFGKVSSKATLRLRKVFLNEDKAGGVRSHNPKRIRMSEQFLDQIIEKGLKGAQLMPHEIVEKILLGKVSKSEGMVLDAQWKSLRESVVSHIQTNKKDFDPTKMVPLSDVSASMSGTPMHVAIALGILISEITHEAFRGLVMTFETKPRWHKLDPSWTIVEKVQSLKRAPWGGSTNFQAAQELILQVALKSKLDRANLPILIVFSDMQFNAAAGYDSYLYQGTSADACMTSMHEHIEERYATIGGSLGWEDMSPPPIVYWNLRNTGGHPVNKDQEGAVLLSGFSPSLLKLVMQGKVFEDVEVEVVQADGTTKKEKVCISPEQVLFKMLNDEQYDPVKEIVGESEEGKLAFVETVPAEDVQAESKEIENDYELVA